LSFIYEPLVGGDAGSFLPFVAFAFHLAVISQLVLDGCNVFIANGPIIEQLRALNCDVVKEGVNGFFAITEEQWIGNLELSRQSPPISAWAPRAKQPRSRSACARPYRTSPKSRSLRQL
jgi:hypothetical protein